MTAEVYTIDVSFAALPDKGERDYLNLQPTSFVLPAKTACDQWSAEFAKQLGALCND